ncbi:chemotaxis protein CheW [Paenibacillus tianjinensis]|uniref:Purine-binding chemotaxis protein CheW n=1 Tax=Paenibacillus tianjinensis TaxID=2810347 RepID=A0ABX7LJ09_9BACL|nr:chemotaxis protein CheW [Paenibacillus tianjinensis]QSF46964.1 purine-binding chemotaxis protein CheW [Paenibacillus tianjinensis]
MAGNNVYEESPEEDTQRDKYLIFSLGRQFYGIEIEYVTEIIGLQPIAGIPDLPEYIKGIINLRGKIIPVMDVRLRFRMEPQPYNDRTCVIVIDILDEILGLIVESVSEVLPIPPEEIVPAPDSPGSGRFVTRIGKTAHGVKLLLDCAKLLRDAEPERPGNAIQPNE